MTALALPALVARAHADQVAQLYAGWHRTSMSMLLGATLLCIVMWGAGVAVVDGACGAC